MFNTLGGRNGYGAKLCNIFSTKFTVETSCKDSKKTFKQVKMKENTKFFNKRNFGPNRISFEMEKM